MDASIISPLRIDKGKLQKFTDPILSINNFLDLLINTPCGSTPCDTAFGFIFNNLRFEIFDENEGVVFDSKDILHDKNDSSNLYNKKISGTSKSINAFAQILKKSIVDYEKRLTNVNVSMTYVRETRLIYITVKGYIPAIDKEYTYHNNIKIWN